MVCPMCDNKLEPESLKEVVFFFNILKVGEAGI